MQKQVAEILVKTAKKYGIECSLYEGYKSSSNDMEETTGIVVNNITDFFYLSFFLGRDFNLLSDDIDREINDKLVFLSIDDLGKNSIIY